MVVMNKIMSPPKKHISAIPSYRASVLIDPRMDKKERIQLAMNNMIAKVVNSSITVF